MRTNGVLTNGKFEGLTHISNVSACFTMVATDQRGSLKRMISPENPKGVTAKEMKAVKQALIRSFAGRSSGGHASGVLVDPEYSYEKRFLDACDIRADVGVLMGVEETGYGGKGEYEPKVTFFNCYPADKAVRKVWLRGASAVKLLIYYRQDSPSATYQKKMVAAVGRACEKYDLPFLLEPVAHSLESGPNKKKNPREYAEIKPKLVVEAAEELTKPKYSVDVLKSEFPLDLRYAEELGQDPSDACRMVDEASRTPWVILSAGVDFDMFKETLKYAVANGASGFLCGRALWKEAVGKKDIDKYLQTEGAKRISLLAKIVENGRPWYKKYVDSISDIKIRRGE